MSDYDAMEALGVEVHPEADKLDLGSRDKPGRCICGEPLPPQRDWCDFGLQWQHIQCTACRRLYVDEDEFTAIYDEPDDDSCERCQVRLTVEEVS